jgi:hypothetical protein
MAFSPKERYNPIVDGLHCATRKVTGGNRFDVRYGKGMVVGVIVGVMSSQGCTYDEAIVYIKRQVSNKILLDPSCVPDGMETDLATITAAARE